MEDFTDYRLEYRGKTLIAVFTRAALRQSSMEKYGYLVQYVSDNGESAYTLQSLQNSIVQGHENGENMTLFEAARDELQRRLDESAPS